MPVKKVVDPLGHTKEVRASPHNEPMGVDATRSRVRHQRSQHLGDTAADRRRADRPQRPAREHLAGARLRVDQALPSSRPRRLAQPSDRHGRQRDLLDRPCHPSARSARAIAAERSPQPSKAANTMSSSNGRDSGAEASIVTSRPHPNQCQAPGSESSAYRDCRNRGLQQSRGAETTEPPCGETASRIRARTRDAATPYVGERPGASGHTPIRSRRNYLLERPAEVELGHDRGCPVLPVRRRSSKHGQVLAEDPYRRA